MNQYDPSTAAGMAYDEIREGQRQRLRGLCPSDATACSPSYSARFRLGQEVVELRVPTGDLDTTHCWHGLDLASAKRLRDELIKSVETLEAFAELRESIPENACLSHGDDSASPTAPTKDLSK